MIFVQPQAYEKFVLNVQEAIVRKGKINVRLSTGDVIAAWIFKVCTPTSGFIVGKKIFIDSLFKGAFPEPPCPAFQHGLPPHVLGRRPN